MGVSGCGKSTLGARLASVLGWAFQEGDALHPPANVAKMASGRPLDDGDRAPWLAATAAWIDRAVGSGQSGVVTCSALKRAYRTALIDGRPDVRLVFPNAAKSLIAARLAGRSGHFMPAALLDSQFAALEPPGPDERAVELDASTDVEAQVARVRTALGV